VGVPDGIEIVRSSTDWGEVTSMSTDHSEYEPVNRSRPVRRRHIAVGAATVAAVAAVMVGGAACASTKTTPTAAPTATPTTTPTTTPSSTASPATTAANLPASHYSSSITVPPWPAYDPCPGGPLSFTDGLARTPDKEAATRLLSLANGALGGQPAMVVAFQCGDVGGDVQLASYRGAAGAYTPMGKFADIPGHVGFVNVFGAQIAITPTEVVVTVSLQQTYPYVNRATYLTQVRRYGLNGSALVQTAGPTKIVADASDASLTISGNVVFDPAQNGCRKGTITYTVTNSGSKPAEVSAVLSLPIQFAADCPAAPGAQENGVVAAPITVPANQSRTATATIYQSERTGVGPVPPQTVPAYPFNIIEMTVDGVLYPVQTPIGMQYL
jgi:hypothetical protein